MSALTPAVPRTESGLAWDAPRALCRRCRRRKKRAIEVNSLARRVRQVAGGLEVFGERRDTEHAAAVGDELALIVPRGAGVEDHDLAAVAAECLRLVDPGDQTTLAYRPG